jgi:4-aminobutyrate aminotransferase
MACAAALATLDVIEEEGLLERATRLGEHLHRRLLDLQDRHELIGDVRGLGLMQAIELVKDRRTKEPAVGERDRAVELAYKRGLILLPAGSSVIRLIPPLVVEEDFIDEGVDILDRALRDAVSG